MNGAQDGCGVGNNWNWCKVRETCKWDTKFRSDRSNRENGPTFLDFPSFPGIFQWDEPTKRLPFTAKTEISENLTKWKAPLVIWSVYINGGLYFVRQLPPFTFLAY